MASATLMKPAMFAPLDVVDSRRCRLAVLEALGVDFAHDRLQPVIDFLAAPGEA